MSLYLGSGRIGEVRIGTAAAGINAVALNQPTINLSSTGLITATITQPDGFVTATTRQTTQQIPTQGAITITPSSGTQLAAEAGKYLTGNIMVAAIDANYVGTGITKNPNPTVSGRTVTIPAGYYSGTVTRQVAETSHPAVSISMNSGTGLITVEHSQTTGYVTAHTSSGTLQLTIKGATTYTPTTTDQTITSGTYLIGTQTIKGDANLIAANIAEGVTIFGIAGAHSGSTPISLQNKTVDPTESGFSINADAGYTGLGTVTVNPIDDMFVGSGIARKSSSDLTTSGATVTAPAGYYASAASKSVATGSAGTPSASKGTVNNHSISITPSVTNTTGYITGGTKTGTAVTVSASELVSGSETKTSNGTYDVTNLASLIVSVPTGSTIKNQNKTINSSENNQTVTFDVDSNNYTGLGTVTINGLGSGYVGSGISRRTSTDVSSMWEDVSIPAGYYANDTTYSFPTGGIAAPGISVSDTGLITASTHGSREGYISTGDMASNTKQLSTQSGITITPTASIQTAVASGKFTTGTVYVGAIPSNYIIPSGTKNISANGTGIDVTAYASVNVAVPSDAPALQIKTVTYTPSDNQQTDTITPGSGYGGLSEVNVTVNAIPGNYIGANIPENDSNDLNVNGPTVSAPAGYYASDASATVETMTLPTSASSSAAASSTLKATINRNTSDQYINIPTGYNTAKGHYKISAVPNGSYGTPSWSFTKNTNSYIVDLSYPNFTAGYMTSSPGSSINLHLQNEVITPTSETQTVTPSSNYYYINSVTVNGDANLIASNIKSGVSIFGVNGSYSGEAGLDTSDATATTADILATKTAYVNGEKITGAMVNNGATGGTINTQGGTYTIPAGYTTGGTVTANLSSTTLTNSIFTSNTGYYLEATNDYGWKTEITLPAGYYSGGTVSKTYSQVLPAPTTAVAASGMLLGYQAYDKDGKVLTGTMPNNSDVDVTLSGSSLTYTVPAGYHNGSGTVKVNTGSATAPASITGTTATVSTGTNTLTLTKSVSVTPNVTAGYISAGTAGNSSVSLTASVTTKGATTYRASTSQQTLLSAGTYATGAQTLAAVTQTNLSAANIKAGTTISVSNGSSNLWSVTGTFTSDANATAADINSGITAYVNGTKITGTQVINKFYTGSSAPSSSLGSNGDIYLQE